MAVFGGSSKVSVYQGRQISLSGVHNVGVLSLQGKDRVFGSDRRSVAKDKVASAQFQLVVETTHTKSSEEEAVTKGFRTYERRHTITGPVVMKGFRHLGRGRENYRWGKMVNINIPLISGEDNYKTKLYL